MIDNLSLGLTHGLMLLAAWSLIRRRDLVDGAAGNDAPLRGRRGRKRA